MKGVAQATLLIVAPASLPVAFALAFSSTGVPAGGLALIASHDIKNMFLNQE
jgi:hypothetical protein